MKKILIANRGEIACRVIKTCKKLGIQTVAVYSDADVTSLHARLADEAVHIGGLSSTESYLDQEKIIAACKSTNSDAVHPGYGFLSENAKFAEKCRSCGIKFIGPDPGSITSIGDKSSAKTLLKSRAPSVPLIPGYNGDDQSVPTLTKQAVMIGFPVLLKASAGGGGKGMRIVRSEASLSEEIEMAKGEASRSFGDDKLLIEKYFEYVKHVEVQIMGDQLGNVYHCFERECSVQRRHQKVIEETPSPALTPELRHKMCQAAVTIGKLLKYEGAGTVEFIVDTRDMKFYFLEVNTRLQVEHPITEAITGLDLVELQIHVASGRSLENMGLDKLKINGHAIESRLYAEDPNNNFYPCTGTVLQWNTPTANKAGYPRFDTGICSGSEISIYYDPLISKITTWGKTREEALLNMEYALRKTICLGLISNKEFLLKVLQEEKFLNGSYTTRLIEGMSELTMPQPVAVIKASIPNDELPLSKAPHRWYNVEKSPTISLSMGMESGIVGAIWFAFHMQNSRRGVWKGLSIGWRTAGIKWKAERVEFQLNNLKQSTALEYVSVKNSWETLQPGQPQKFLFRFVSNVNEKSELGSKKDNENPSVKKELVTPWISVTATNINDNGSSLVVTIDKVRKSYAISFKPLSADDHPQLFVYTPTWPKQVHLTRVDPLKSAAEAVDDVESAYTSHMPCKILKLLAQDGALVKANQPLLTMESMKMETRLYSRHEGTVKFMVKEGQVVEAGKVMVQVESSLASSNENVPPPSQQQ